ncbi:ribose-phosphate diphosphokinase [Pleurocapsales cyanobacterium LEGE 06147]|nr:ribose-phosphate diphosphokinase [Pleurocapsales cyanobacterium LEGE 06147]
MKENFILFSGTANRPLAEAIARQLGVSLGNCTIERFPDGEVSVEIDESVNERIVFLVQPTSPPVDANLIELLAFADACRRAGASSIIAIVPYFGYARGDKRHGSSQAIMARLVADLMQTAGINRVVTVDLHAPQIEGFFQIPVDSLTATPILYEALNAQLLQETVVVSPDTGRIPMALEFAGRLGIKVAVLHKQRSSGTQTDITHVIGEVEGKACLIVDDMISTGGTIVNSIETLLKAGAKPEITVAATHGLLVQNAKEKLSCQSLQQILITDTIPQQPQDWTQLQVVSLGSLLGTEIKRIVTGNSLVN